MRCRHVHTRSVACPVRFIIHIQGAGARVKEMRRYTEFHAGMVRAACVLGQSGRTNIDHSIQFNSEFHAGPEEER